VKSPSYVPSLYSACSRLTKSAWCGRKKVLSQQEPTPDSPGCDGHGLQGVCDHHQDGGRLVISISSRASRMPGWPAGAGPTSTDTYAFVCGPALTVAKVQVHCNRRSRISIPEKEGCSRETEVHGHGLTIKPNVRRVWPQWPL